MTMACLLCDTQVPATHDALKFHFGAFHPETKPLKLGPQSRRADIINRMETRMGAHHFL